jgi:hypothetical protein
MDNGATMMKHIRRVIACAAIALAACVNNGTASLTASTTYPMSLRVALPAYPNKKFSAYVFANNALVGVVRSTAVLDSAGSLTVDVMAVNANNCITSKQALAPSDLVYHIHSRVDSNGNSLFINPTGCPTDAGFLATAGQGYVEVKHPTSYAAWPNYIGYVYATSNASFSFTNTGLGNAAGVRAQCSIFDAQILNPTVLVTSALGGNQQNMTFSGGTSTTSLTTTPFTFASGSGTTVKYACWIDANNSNTYNSGDLISSGPGTVATVSNWTTIP